VLSGFLCKKVQGAAEEMHVFEIKITQLIFKVNKF
jgi:hypothetical protein